ncbi:hypothetical protein AMECASPLE_036245 [Ameca splendens]|uniref:Uncharacterized protein n=1 Tax=Ameca splendens TaxID=208324 RepID=A0ABV0XWL8_9TELE
MSWGETHCKRKVKWGGFYYLFLRYTQSGLGGCTNGKNIFSERRPAPDRVVPIFPNKVCTYLCLQTRASWSSLTHMAIFMLFMGQLVGSISLRDCYFDYSLLMHWFDNYHLRREEEGRN